jgi:hypothetical protein
LSRRFNSTGERGVPEESRQKLRLPFDLSFELFVCHGWRITTNGDLGDREVTGADQRDLHSDTHD